MVDTPSQDSQTPNEEASLKLRQIRTNYTRAQNILTELEAYFSRFEDLRKNLDDDQEGLQANLDWSKSGRKEIYDLVVVAQQKAQELEQATSTVSRLVSQVQKQVTDFEPLAAKVVDPTIGIEAMHTQATNLTGKITSLLETARADTASVATQLASIKAQSKEVKEAYDAFLELKETIDDPDTGISSQIDEIDQYAKDALKAKTSAESELAAVISIKDRANEDLETVKDVKAEIETHKAESETLTNDIRNNLGLSSAHSLSKAITDQRKRIEHSVWLWGIGVGIGVLLLGMTLGIIFYTIFLDPTSKDLFKADGIGMLTAVLSKALFGSPFVFALYFATTNFSRVRDLRDRYRSKEIAAKNLQAYVKLLRDEFPNNSKERLEFALRNMQAIYNDPVPGQRKRRYNIGINKIFQFDVQEEEAEQLKEKLLEGAEELVNEKVG